MEEDLIHYFYWAHFIVYFSGFKYLVAILLCNGLIKFLLLKCHKEGVQSKLTKIPQFHEGTSKI